MQSPHLRRLFIDASGCSFTLDYSVRLGKICIAVPCGGRRNVMIIATMLPVSVSRRARSATSNHCVLVSLTLLSLLCCAAASFGEVAQNKTSENSKGPARNYVAEGSKAYRELTQVSDQPGIRFQLGGVCEGFHFPRPHTLLHSSAASSVVFDAQPASCSVSPAVRVA